MTDWIEVKRVANADGRRCVSFQRCSTGLFRYEHRQWQRYYEPSPEDQTADVVGGLWAGRASGLFDSLAEAEQGAREAVDWLRDC